jgi:hypothetical protein
LSTAGLIAGVQAAESPLDRLQQRSGEERWDELRSKSQSPAAAPLPAALSPKAPGSSLFNAARLTPPAAEDGSAPPAPPLEGQSAVKNANPSEPAATPAVDEEAFAEPPHPFTPRALPLGLFADEREGGREGHSRPLPAGTSFVHSQQVPAPEANEALPSVSQTTPKTFALRPITDIQPFFDYSPNGEDPCKQLCPVPEGLCPDDPNRLCPEPLEMPMAGSAERFFPHLEFYWSASNLYHNPLYFENPALERYGHVHFNDCVEPAYSMARFGAQFVGLPYQMALDCACRRQYALGWYRPGDFAPKLIYQPPLNARAAGTAAAFYTGLFFLVP